MAKEIKTIISKKGKNRNFINCIRLFYIFSRLCLTGLFLIVFLLSGCGDGPTGPLQGQDDQASEQMEKKGELPAQSSRDEGGHGKDQNYK